MSEKERFVVSTNTVGEIIVTDTETGNVYHYGNMGNFLGLIRLLNEQQDTINKLREILAEAEDMIEVRLAEHYIKEYENIKHHIIGDNDE